MKALSEKSAALNLLIGCVVFSLGSIIVAKVPVGSYAIAFWRLAVAAVIFAVLMRLFAQRFPKNRKAIGWALLSGVFLGFDLALWHESIHAVGPGIATVLNCLQIFWITAMGLLFFGEKLTRQQVISLVLAMLGVIMIASPEFGHNHHALWGLFTGLASGLALAISMMLVRKTHETAKTPIFVLMWLLSVGGMLTLIVPMLLWNGDSLLPQTWTQASLIVIYGAVMQCFAWGMIAYALPLLSLSVAGLLLLSEPVAALWIDFVFLDKPISTIQWLGAVLTMVAIYLGSLKKKK
ncbi:DMT family transporter [Wielerella bovis]|uniref:DMT family transporter n=1 Tax=Wielerella bovis TaxID=2917790 RepID=UPI002019CBDE|nr:DMT family transporter [Wielerella bovis]ULJ61107.1 DMT family transporter [Wielerella bovis]